MARGEARGEARAQAGAGPDMVHLLAERKARTMFTDLMASAGLGNHRIAKEVIYFMPQDLLDVYEELWYMGTGGKDGGGTGARGAAQSEAGALGKAGTDNSGSYRTNSGARGTMYISGGGSSKRKKYKKYWVIADEDALDIKDRADKRLRGLARDLRAELDELKMLRKLGAARLAEAQKSKLVDGEGKAGVGAGAGGDGPGTRIGWRCSCGKLMRADWEHCPYDGRIIERK